MTLFWLGLAWLAGITIGRLEIFTTLQWSALAAVSLASLGALRRHRPQRWVFGLVLLATLGAARGQASLPDFDDQHILHYNDIGVRVILSGVVDSPPESRDASVVFDLKVESLRLPQGEPVPVHGRVMVSALPALDLAYGDLVEVAGYAETPPVFEDFSYRAFLARRGIHTLVRRAEVARLGSGGGSPWLTPVYAFRARAHRSLLALFPEPEASLLAGILLGIEGGIPEHLRQAFDRTSTTHIIAISGFNITIIAGIFVSLLRRWLGARWGAWAAGGAIAVYTLLVGADAAVVRAAIMGGLGLLALRLGRQSHALASLAGAAMLMSLAKPAVLEDAGFQLSFMATLGLIVYARPWQVAFEAWAQRRLGLSKGAAARLGGPVGEFLLFTLAAQLTTLPLSLYSFRRLSLAALLANPLILPLQPPAMILGGVATLLGSLWAPLGQLAAWIAWPFPALTIRIVEAFSAWRYAALELTPLSPMAVAGLYALIFAVTLLPRLPIRAQLPSLQGKDLPIGFGLGALAVATGLAWKVAAQAPDGLLHVTLLEVGDGNAVLVQSPTGRSLLVDGGASPLALQGALGGRLPLFAGALDWVVLSGASEDRIGGLAGLYNRHPIGAALVPPGAEGRAYGVFAEGLSQAGRPMVEAHAGMVLQLGGGAELEVIGAGRAGAALLLRHGRFGLLLAGGEEPALTAELMRAGRAPLATAVLLAAGGSAAANPPDWLEHLSPQLALISVAAGNREGLPSPEVLRALEGVTVLRTDQHGWIELVTDGEALWVTVERQPLAEP